MSDIKQKRKGEERKGGLKPELSLYRSPRKQGASVCALGQRLGWGGGAQHKRTQLPGELRC